MTTALPSGRQFEIRHGDQVAHVTEVGATLRAYTVGGVDVLDGFGEDEVCSAGRGQHLIPWPNRIRDGRYDAGGKTQQLPHTEPAKHNAIHGLTRWLSWTPVDVSEDQVTLAVTVPPQPGWPTVLRAEVTHALGEDGLTVTTTSTNLGAVAVPYGTGSHPYLTFGAATVDGLLLTLPAASYLLADDRGIPVDPTPVDGTAYDFRRPRAVGDIVLDTAYTDLARDDDGRVRVLLAEPEGSRAITVWGDEAHGWLQVFTGDTLPAGKARAGLAVEPMTCGPDAFNTGAGVVTLGPGESHRGSWGISTSGY